MIGEEEESCKSDDLHAVAALDGAALDYLCIDPHIALILLHSRTKDARVFRQIALGQRRHDTAAGGAGHGKLHLADLQGLADPGLFDETLPVFGSGHEDVRTEAPGLEPAFRINLVQLDQRGNGNQMDGGAVEERPTRQREVGDGVPSVQPIPHRANTARPGRSRWVAARHGRHSSSRGLPPQG